MFATIETDRFAVITVAEGTRPAAAWQTLFGWPASGHQAVPLTVRSTADRKRWAAQLDAAIRAADRQVLLVAEGLGCAASAWWARLSPRHDVARVAGALLFAPQTATPDLFASPRDALPFPSLVIRPGGAQADLERVTREWGSGLMDTRLTRDVRGTPAWRHAQRLFLRVTKAVAEHEVARGAALIGLDGGRR
jgi:predicted alpha/beta hydrolase family esterase